MKHIMYFLNLSWKTTKNVNDGLYSGIQTLILCGDRIWYVTSW